MIKRCKKEEVKTIRSKYWYWRGNDIFGEGREEGRKQKVFGK
jgi:hypothetical protein